MVIIHCVNVSYLADRDLVFDFGLGPHQWNIRLSVLLDINYIKVAN